MRKQPKVSVIIPMYNISSYVEVCFGNLASQTLTDFEVIFIDDCSLDDSKSRVYEAIREFSRKDISFIQLQQDVNMGVACARNRGLECASGEYVYFYDADDRLEPDTLSALYEEAKLRNVDIVGCEWYISFSHNERHIKQGKATTGVELFKGFTSGVIRWNLWLFLVRRSLYDRNGLRFLPGKNMGEDMMLMLKLSLVATGVSIVHRPLYHYVQTNTEAQTRNWSKEKREQVTANVYAVETFCKDKFNDTFDLEIDFLKQAIKLPYLISDKREDYKVWSEWFPESDRSIRLNKVLPFRTRILQRAAAKRQYWFLWLYYLSIYKVLYGVIYR